MMIPRRGFGRRNGTKIAKRNSERIPRSYKKQAKPVVYLQRHAKPYPTPFDRVRTAQSEVI